MASTRTTTIIIHPTLAVRLNGSAPPVGDCKRATIIIHPTLAVRLNGSAPPVGDCKLEVAVHADLFIEVERLSLAGRGLQVERFPIWKRA